MQLKEERLIKAEPQQVFAALNDVAILQACIPGCEKLERQSETEMTAQVTLKLGPVNASFKGDIVLSDINPPHGYTISGQGQGGAAGLAKGSATVELIASDDGTILRYNVEAQVSGKLAQLGSRLIDSAAKKLASQFFNQFAIQLQPPEEDASSKTPAADKTDDFKWAMVGGAILVIAIVALLVAVGN